MSPESALSSNAPPATDAVRQFWPRCVAASLWHVDASAALTPVATALTRQLPADLACADAACWQLLDHAHALVLGYQPELGRAGVRLLEELQDTLAAALAATTPDWNAAATAIAGLGERERGRAQRIEQRLLDTAEGQLRSQRARQQAAQLLNRAMAGKKLGPAIVAWLQGDWFGELQWCLLHHGDGGSAWQRRAELTLALVTSLQPPNEESGGRQTLYTEVPRVGAALRELLTERAPSAAALEQTLGLIEQQHLLLLKGQLPATEPFKLIVADHTWFADISLSRDMLARTQALAIGDWFLLREDGGDRRVKLILKQDDAGQLLFVNQLGIKALQVSVEEFAYRLGAEMALPLPRRSLAREAWAQTQAALLEQQRGAESARREAAAEQARLDAVAQAERDRQTRLRAEARDKAAAEARALAAAQAEAAALAAQQQAAAELAERERESARRRAAIARQGGDETLRQRHARQQATMVSIGHWIEFHSETGHLQRLKLAVKLPTSGKLIFVDREGIRRAELSRDQLVDRLLEGSAHIADQGPQFEDTLARVVDGLRRDRQPERTTSKDRTRES